MSRGTYIRTKQTRTKLSKSKLGQKYPNRQKPPPVSETHRKNLSKALTGRKQTAEHIKHSSQANTKEKILIMCQFCNSSKHVIPSKIDTKFCSRKCHYAAGHTEEAKEKLRQKRLLQILPTKDTSIELKIQNILTTNNIIFNKHIILLKKYQSDIFIKPNIVIECDGDYWHNRPDMKERDRIKDIALKNAGYTILRFWEHEINENVERCFNTIHNTIFQTESI